jgi:hypothetical protein
MDPRKPRRLNPVERIRGGCAAGHPKRQADGKKTAAANANGGDAIVDFISMIAPSVGIAACWVYVRRFPYAAVVSPFRSSWDRRKQV